MAADIPDEDWIKVKMTVDRISHIVEGNGKPPLWERMKEYVDKRDAHKERNIQQDMADLRKEQDDRHKDNQRKFDKLFQLVYIGMGIMIALESIGIFKR